MKPSLLLFVALLAAAPARAEEPLRFNRDIRPILSDKCFACHGPDAANRKTKLRFDIESGAKIELGKGRYAIVPGNPAKSEMISRITSANVAMRMPPAYAKKEKLSDREIDLLRRWIAQGAAWEAFWSFIPPKSPVVPRVREQDRVRNPIDSFVFSRLEREGLRPSPEADKSTLIRRVTLDLTGVSATPAETDAFLADNSADAYGKVVDRLLSSPRYAEQQTMHWLDSVRYADTCGFHGDNAFPAWPYRDYVLHAYRDKGIFYEQVTNQILDDLVALLQPRRMTVIGDFSVRGGIKTIVKAEHNAKG